MKIQVTMEFTPCKTCYEFAKMIWDSDTCVTCQQNLELLKQHIKQTPHTYTNENFGITREEGDFGA